MQSTFAVHRSKSCAKHAPVFLQEHSGSGEHAGAGATWRSIGESVPHGTLRSYSSLPPGLVTLLASLRDVGANSGEMFLQEHCGKVVDRSRWKAWGHGHAQLLASYEDNFDSMRPIIAADLACLDHLVGFSVLGCNHLGLAVS